MKRLISVIATAGLAVTGVAAASTAHAAPREGGGPGIDWTTCADQTLAAAGAECGFLRVPLDHSRPGGRKIQIAVSRIKASVPPGQRQGVMLVNPGGPGGSGLIFPILRDLVPKGAGRAYDWIGFDPRGVGSNKPALSCIPNYFHPNRPDYRAFTDELEEIWLARSSRYAAACDRNNGELLDHMKTTDVVADMELIRRALGEKTINYYGFSYGTYLGQVYSTLHPDRVRRLVFDGNVDPRSVWYRANLQQDVAFDRVLTIFFAWVARYDSVYHLGETQRAVERRYYRELNRLARHPANGILGPDEWNDAFVGAGYADFLWPQTADLFAAWANDKNPDPAIAAYRSGDSVGDDNGFAVYNAVQCTDATWPNDYDVWRADGFRTYARAPFLTWSNVWFNAACIFWPGTSARPVPVDGSKVRSLLLINQTLDAATPYSGALEVRRRYPNASLVAEPGGTTHAGSLSGNACVDDRIADYLLTGALPARKPGNRADVRCTPMPHPVPDQLATSDASRAASKAKAVRHSLVRPRN